MPGDTVWAWGVITCGRCARASTVVVEEPPGLHRLSGIACGRCQAPASARWLWRGGTCTTEALAVIRAETWQARALAEPLDDPPKRGA